MKKRILYVFSFLSALTLMLTGCQKDSPVNEPTQTDTNPENEQYTVIDGSKIGNNYAFITYSLSEYNNKNVTIEFSAEMKVENTGSKNERLMWQVNISSYPVIAEHTFKPGTTDFIKVSGKKEDIRLSDNNTLYLSTYQTTTAKLKITLRNINYKVTVKPEQIVVENGPYWCDDSVTSFKDTYRDYFDYVGFAVTGDELTNTEIQKGLKKHASTTTMGNEFKPDFVFDWKLNNTQTKDFTASNGKTIKVPSNIPAFTNQDNYLKICKDLGIKMRGHVLVWHSQTPAAFFRENYNEKGSLVDKDTMTARQEWYIKTVLEHVDSWEKANNNGEHIIWAWDVVNEAVADGQTGALRSQGSDWYSIYQNDEFIVNAFRFANKYAPEDVLLCYNDYNCTDSGKRSGMLKILDDVIKAKNDSTLPPTRIDVMGMQSHINKYTTTASFEQAVKDFTGKGLDVHVTELDIGTEEKYDSAELANVYGNFFKMFIKNRKTDSALGISSITIWGINDETTWLNSASQIVWHQNTTQYPLLFAKNPQGQFVCKEAFDAVIKAASN